MAKSKRIPLNRLVLPGTFETVKLLAEQLECSEGEVVDKAVEALAVVQSFGVEALKPPQPASLVTPQEVSRYTDPSQILGVSRGPAGQFPCRCVHSGCRGAKFQGASKFANLCPACRESGHAGEPRSCRSCFDDMGPT